MIEQPHPPAWVCKVDRAWCVVERASSSVLRAADTVIYAVVMALWYTIQCIPPLALVVGLLLVAAALVPAIPAEVPVLGIVAQFGIVIWAIVGAVLVVAAVFTICEVAYLMAEWFGYDWRLRCQTARGVVPVPEPESEIDANWDAAWDDDT